MTARSIGFRLTAWYLGVLLSAMALFGGGIWFALRSALLSHLNEALTARIHALGYFLEKESHGWDLAAVREEAREYASGLPADHGMRVFSAGRELFSREPSGAQEVRWVSANIQARGHHLRVEMAAPADQVSETLGILRSVLIGLIPLMLIGAGFGGWWLSRRALKPVDEMTAAAEAVSVTDLAARLSFPQTNDELQRLGHAWNRMLERISTSVHQMRRFTADAAHELRTPAAIIRSGAELALHRERTPGEYQSLLRTIVKESASLSELIEDLMWLARHDAETLPKRREPVNFGEIAAGAADAIRPVAASKEISLSVAHPGQSETVVLGDAASLRRLVLILLDNAIKFSPDGGSVELAISLDDQVQFEVRNSGPGVAPEHLPHVFDRFYRSDPARTTPGAGLGLSIAKAIVEDHGGSIGIASEGEAGTVVRVVLGHLVMEPGPSATCADVADVPFGGSKPV
jgi:signal transduction histidine kinase